MRASVAWISIAPVKGLALVALEQAELTEAGIREDRRFHVIDARGRLTNGKRLGKLQRVRPSYDEDTRHLTLTFPDGAEVGGEPVAGEPAITVFYGRPVHGAIVEGPFNEALSAFIGEPLRLVQPARLGAATDRGRSGAVTLLGTSGLGPLGEAAGVGAPLDGRRFRMTFGIDGIEPGEEDGWVGRAVRVGDAVVAPQGHVGRCLITSRDPDTGVTDVDTLEALRRIRGDVESTEPLPFGIHAAVTQPGRVRLGDPVQVV